VGIFSKKEVEWLPASGEITCDQLEKVMLKQCWIIETTPAGKGISRVRLLGGTNDAESGAKAVIKLSGDEKRYALLPRNKGVDIIVRSVERAIGMRALLPGSIKLLIHRMSRDTPTLQVMGFRRADGKVSALLTDDLEPALHP